MLKRCQHCGFKNPPDVKDCLFCHRDLPVTKEEFKKGIEAIKKATTGDWSGIAKKTRDDFVQGQVSSIKYRFHPIWILRLKLYRLKQSLISLFWVFGIIAITVVLGLIYNFLAKIFK